MELLLAKETEHIGFIKDQQLFVSILSLHLILESTSVLTQDMGSEDVSHEISNSRLTRARSTSKDHGMFPFIVLEYVDTGHHLADLVVLGSMTTKLFLYLSNCGFFNIKFLTVFFKRIDHFLKWLKRLRLDVH